MPKVVYTVAKGLVQSGGAGINIEKGNATMAGAAGTGHATSGILSIPAGGGPDTGGIDAGSVMVENTVTNSHCKADSVVLLSIIGTNNAANIVPVPFLYTVADGSFGFAIGNGGTGNITSSQVGDLKVAYLIV
jgi:hypothetical protein